MAATVLLSISQQASLDCCVIPPDGILLDPRVSLIYDVFDVVAVQCDRYFCLANVQERIQPVAQKKIEWSRFQMLLNPQPHWFRTEPLNRIRPACHQRTDPT